MAWELRELLAIGGREHLLPLVNVLALADGALRYIIDGATDIEGPPSSQGDPASPKLCCDGSGHLVLMMSHESRRVRFSCPPSSACLPTLDVATTRL